MGDACVVYSTRQLIVLINTGIHGEVCSSTRRQHIDYTCLAKRQSRGLDDRSYHSSDLIS